MATPANMWAPAPGMKFLASSGNTYVANAQNILFNVQPGDTNDLQGRGCVLLLPRNNVNSNRSPTGSDDFTSGYGIGSYWNLISGGAATVYVCVGMTTSPGGASWVQIGSSGSVIVPTSQTVTTSAAITAQVILVNNTSGGNITLTLQNGSYSGGMNVEFLDIAGNAAVHSVTIAANSGNVRSAASFIEAGAYFHDQFFFDGANWW